MPATLAAISYPVTAYDIENMRSEDGTLSRDSIEHWLSLHSGDFQGVDDFHAVLPDLEIPWQSEESEFQFSDYMYPSEAE